VIRVTELMILEASGDITHVAIAGPLDLDGVKAIERRFGIQTTVRRRPTIVDLSGVESISSLGIGMLVEAARGLACSPPRRRSRISSC
jgi:anti-anti-sigma regulatory factor